MSHSKIHIMGVVFRPSVFTCWVANGLMYRPLSAGSRDRDNISVRLATAFESLPKARRTQTLVRWRYQHPAPAQARGDIAVGVDVEPEP